MRLVSKPHITDTHACTHCIGTIPVYGSFDIYTGVSFSYHIYHRSKLKSIILVLQNVYFSDLQYTYACRTLDKIILRWCLWYTVHTKKASWHDLVNHFDTEKLEKSAYYSEDVIIDRISYGQ